MNKNEDNILLLKDLHTYEYFVLYGQVYRVGFLIDKKNNTRCCTKISTNTTHWLDNTYAVEVVEVD